MSTLHGAHPGKDTHTEKKSEAEPTGSNATNQHPNCGMGKCSRTGGHAGVTVCASCDDQTAAHWTSASTDGDGRMTYHRERKNQSQTRKHTDNNTANRGRGNSEIEQQLENEPARDIWDMAKMEIRNIHTSDTSARG
jgi:hypothetical protein